MFKIHSVSPQSHLEILSSLEEKKAYAESNLNFIASGSSRLTYRLDQDLALKLAYNEAGIEQNKVEASIESSNYFNTPIESAHDYSWIIVPLVESPISEEEFNIATGIFFSDFEKSIKYSLKDPTKEIKKPDNFEFVSEKDIVKEVCKVAINHKLMPGDIVKIKHWRIKDSVPVTIDFGFSEYVWKKFYYKPRQIIATKFAGFVRV